MNFKVLWVCTFSVFAACTNVFYQPSKQHFRSPDEYPVSIKPIDIELKARDGMKLHGWYFKQAEGIKSEGTIIQFHGNAENISTHVVSALWLLNHHYDLFSFDYRGYGKSEGFAETDGIHLDGIAAIEKAIELNNRRAPIYILGQSLGGTVALSSLASIKDKSEIKSVILEGTFYSYKQIAARKLREVWFLWPFSWLGYLLVSNQAAPKNTLPHLPQIPLLVMHSRLDPVVPFEYGQKIFDRAKSPKCFWPIPERGHIGLTSKKPIEYREKFLDFLKHGSCPN